MTGGAASRRSDLTGVINDAVVDKVVPMTVRASAAARRHGAGLAVCDLKGAGILMTGRAVVMDLGVGRIDRCACGVANGATMTGGAAAG